MTKEKFLTIGWNNLFTLVLGIPALIFIFFALSNSVWSEKSEFIVLSIIGVVY